nr:serine/threonine-protein kinase [Acanthopleuribacter pedis]
MRERYEIIEPLGRGGMGRVFLAWQHRPIRRKVALKFLSPHLSTSRELKRFQAEANTTATLNHAAVVKVYDAVFSETSQPCLVMEYVVGRPLNVYLEEVAPSRDARLALCRDVARGLAYAHRRGVIHRDIKPANLVVCLEDQQPQIKIIDFGIAALKTGLSDGPSARDVAGTGATRYCGTPGYMSPEQMRGEPMDGRGDVFSLGLVLLDALQGREARLTRLREVAEHIPRDRRVPLPEPLGKRGWRAGLSPAEAAVIEKATAVDPAARYADADDLAADLQALREQRVVSPHAHSPRRVLAAWLRRRPLRAALGAALLLLLVVTAGRFHQVRLRLDQMQAESVVKEMGLHQLSSQSQLLLAMINPSIMPATPEMLANLKRISRNLDESRLVAEVQVLLRLELGSAFAYYSDVDAAMGEFEAARRLLEPLPARFDQERIFVNGAAAFLLTRRQQYADAEVRYQHALQEARGKLGVTHELSLALAGGAALLQAETGRTHRALTQFREVLALQERHLPFDNGLLTATRSNFATLLTRTGDLAGAESLLTANLVVLRARHGPRHPLTLRGEHNYLFLLYSQGRVDDALAGLKYLLAVRRDVLGDRHPDVVLTAANVVGLLTATRRHREAVELGEAMVLALDDPTPSRPMRINLQQNTAHAWLELGEPARAERLLAGLPDDPTGGPLAAVVAFTRYEAQFAQGCRREALLGMRTLLRDFEQAHPAHRADATRMRRAFEVLVQEAAGSGDRLPD